MKALSVRQPWASMIAQGDKTIEIRSRPWSYRGPLVICATAAKYWPDQFGGEKVGRPLPYGVAVCVCNLVDCRPLTLADAEACGLDRGDLEPEDCDGQWAWVLEGAREVLPIPVKGQLQPWEWNGPALVECDDHMEAFWKGAA